MAFRSGSVRRIRIRTNNPDRHILLERGLDEVFQLHGRRKFYRLMVVSAEMKESEYDNNCKEWIERMMPGIYEGYENYEWR
ncbi:hypothetical protein B9Z55_012755 [Caenorhabditis nigoni]|nr:hypothetical protein B9Z55_012755 [Caenorhabditis nigoni]